MGLTLDEPKENEEIMTVNGIGVLVEDYAKMFIDEAVVDYVKEDENEGFTISTGAASC